MIARAGESSLSHVSFSRTLVTFCLLSVAISKSTLQIEAADNNQGNRPVWPAHGGLEHLGTVGSLGKQPLDPEKDTVDGFTLYGRYSAGHAATETASITGALPPYGTFPHPTVNIGLSSLGTPAATTAQFSSGHSRPAEVLYGQGRHSVGAHGEQQLPGWGLAQQLSTSAPQSLPTSHAWPNEEQQDKKDSSGPIALSALGNGKIGVLSSVFAEPPTTPGFQNYRQYLGGSTDKSDDRNKREHFIGPFGERGGDSVAPHENVEVHLARLSDGSLPLGKRPLKRAGDKHSTKKRRAEPFRAWRGAQSNNVLVITLGDTTLFQGLCIGEEKSNDSRLPCGTAYPGVATLALHLADGPPAKDARRGSHGFPMQPAVLLSTSVGTGVEGASSVVQNLLERAWNARGNEDCDSLNGGNFHWGMQPVEYFSRDTATREASALISTVDVLIADSEHSRGIDQETKVVYLGSSRASEYATIAAMVASEPSKLIGAYLTIAAEANSTSRKIRDLSRKLRGEPVVEFVFRRDTRSMRGVRLDFSVTLAGPHFTDTTVLQVPAEMMAAVANEIATRLRHVVDKFLWTAFDERTSSSPRPLSPELPVLFVRIQRVRLVRDMAASRGQVVDVELASHTGDPMVDLGVPIVLYTTAIGAAFQAYLLGHLKSSGLANIIRQAIVDVRSLGPLHQPALAGHVTALRDDVSRLHEWLKRAGPEWPITTNIGSLLGLLFKSHEVASGLQGKCNTAVASLDLSLDDPLLGFATMFCQLYPQTYYPSLAGKEELESYSLQVGQTLRRILSGSSVRGESRGLPELSQESFDSDNRTQSRRLAVEDESGGDEFENYGTADDSEENSEEWRSDPSNGQSTENQASQFAARQEEHQDNFAVADHSRNPHISVLSVMADDDLYESENITSTPSDTIVENLPDTNAHVARESSQQHDGRRTRSRAATFAQDNSTGYKEDTSGATQVAPGNPVEGLSIPVTNPQKLMIHQERKGGSSKIGNEAGDQRAFQELQRELEFQRRKQQELLERVEAQLKEQLKKRITDQSNRVDIADPSGNVLRRHSKPSGPTRKQVSQTPPVTFPGINVPQEGDKAIEQLIMSLERNANKESGHMQAVGDRSESARTRRTLTERYGPLFLNLVGFLLNDDMLEDLISVANWHVNPKAYRSICRQSKFSLFYLTKKAGQSF
ncbi:uncharacterized protein LOC34623625 [Cyclospora cayetanensis]|uniref:Uncharacterized protein LOC34623625 n=1 Tax=Cyclospora cayetanensis TaxID=88456 RepID=A0A6P6RZ67_9EIME|nr:uncharacterized protein LOC34623625 [Cyclospora cayetanensis]